MSSGGRAKGKARAIEKLNAEDRRAANRQRLALIDGGFRTLWKLIQATVVLGVSYFMFRSAEALAGKETTLTAAIKAVADLNMNEYFAWSVSAIAGTSWWNERRLRRRVIEGNGPYIKELESGYAPERASSGLLSDGQPKKEDKDA